MSLRQKSQLTTGHTFFCADAAQCLTAYAEKGGQMGKRNPLEDMWYILFDLVVTFGGRVDLQEVATGFGSQQHLHSRASNNLANRGLGFHFGGEFVEVEYPKEGIFSGLDRYFRRLPADGACYISGELSFESKVEVNDIAVFFIIIGAKVTLFHKIDGADFGY